MTAEDLARESMEGRGAVLTAVKELRKAGYIMVVKRQGPRGRWTTETYVFDTPQVSTEVGFPDSGAPDAGAPDVGSLDAIKKTTQKKEQKATTTPNPSTAETAEDSGGGGRDVDRDIEHIRRMLIGQAAASGKANPLAWAAAAIRRIRSDGVDADLVMQLADWRERQARAEATSRAVEAARQSPADAPSSTVGRRAYPGRGKLLEAIGGDRAHAPSPVSARRKVC